MTCKVRFIGAFFACLPGLLFAETLWAASPCGISPLSEVESEEVGQRFEKHLADQRRKSLAEIEQAIDQGAYERILYVSAQAGYQRDGTRLYPFREVQAAVDRAMPGDLVWVDTGRYAPFEVRRSGTEKAPIHIAGATDGAAVALIDGASVAENTRGLISIRHASHIEVSGFSVKNAPFDGIFVVAAPEGSRDIRIANNAIETTGNSGIYVGGIVMRELTAVGEYRLSDVAILNNSVTRTNVPDGVNEAITLGGGVDGFRIVGNHVYETDQYGIDVKAGARNGDVVGNVVRGIEKHGIYIDAGSRTVAGINVAGNCIIASRNGIVLAREARRDPEHPNLFDIVVEDNEIHTSDRFGVLVYRHKADSGRGRFSDISIRSNQICGAGEEAIRYRGLADPSYNVQVAENRTPRGC